MLSNLKMVFCGNIFNNLHPKKQKKHLIDEVRSNIQMNNVIVIMLLSQYYYLLLQGNKLEVLAENMVFLSQFSDQS